MALITSDCSFVQAAAMGGLDDFFGTFGEPAAAPAAKQHAGASTNVLNELSGTSGGGGGGGGGGSQTAPTRPPF